MSKKRINWKGFFSFLVSALVGIVISSVFWYLEKQPTASFNILSNTEVFSLNTEDVNDLQVFYGNENLSKSNKKLMLITVMFANEGSAILNEDQYYSKSPVGVKILNGSIADAPELINTSTKNLAEFTQLKAKGQDSILIDKPPLAVDDYLTFKVLTLTDLNTSEIKVKSFGSINGTNPILIKEVYKEIDYNSNVIWNKILRILGYILVVLIGVIFVYWLFTPKDMNLPIGQKDRQKLVDTYISRYGQLDEVTEKILELYIIYGKSVYLHEGGSFEKSLPHYLWNKFPSGDESIEVFMAIKNFVLFLREKELIHIDEDKKTIIMDDSLKGKATGAVIYIAEMEDDMRRGFSY